MNLCLVIKQDNAYGEAMHNIRACSVGGAGGLGVVGGVAAGADREGEGRAESVVDVPQVAEVDGVVVDAHGFRSGVSSNEATGVSASELEHLVISILAVLGQTGAPDVDIGLLLLHGVGALSGARGGGVPASDLSVDKSVETVAGDLVESGTKVAISMECVILGEVRLSSVGDGGEDSESSHIY